ncbi:MAG TPA: CHAT domain-containing protein, partial [Acidobacteriota bacterium]|nr:CHAT domain-containing protein [Acidobacteriota bacterium]
GRALDALAVAIETLRRQQTPETQRLLDEYAALASQISALTLRGPGQKKPEDHQALIRSLEEQKEKLENDIGQRSKEFQAQTAPIKLESVQKQIPANALLLEYAVYQPFDPKTGKFGESQYVVYTLDQKGNINFAALGPAERIDQSAASLHNVLSRPKAALETEVLPAAQELNRLVVQPIRALIGKADQLLISPDGALSLIPFAALADEKGKFLLESHRLTYLTSGRDLLRLAVKLESRMSPVILADPDYADGKGPLLAGKQFAPLARLVGTKLEGRSLKTLFPDAEIKMQADATEAALKQIQRPELLHIATHGQFVDARAVLPASEDEKRPGITVDVEKLKVENPLLRSWLFFAGANHGGSDENDGTLTALEAAQLDLWGTKLVVLSACETGVGEAKTGDGVYGLRRALVLAGSESQLMSLWSVSDRATRELMVEYYTRLKAGEGRSDALRRVQLKMLKDPKRRHPFYWASFIQSGEWANLAGTRKLRS